MTNPNPVAPKTDTPATQAEDMPYKGSPLERIDNLRAQLSAERASHAQTLSTLAAERASRVQAEEALDCLKMEIMVLYGCDTPEVAFSEIEHLIKKYFPPPAKPSVSPEQEKP